MKQRADQMTIEMKDDELEIRGEVWGGLAVRRLRLPAGLDFTPTLVGLPDDLCQCPHWGKVLEGAVSVRYDDGTEEVARAGDLFYWPAGHTAWTDDGVAFLEISPAEELREVMEHVAAAMAG